MSTESQEPEWLYTYTYRIPFHLTALITLSVFCMQVWRNSKNSFKCQIYYKYHYHSPPFHWRIICIENCVANKNCMNICVWQNEILILIFLSPFIHPEAKWVSGAVWEILIFNFADPNNTVNIQLTLISPVPTTSLPAQNPHHYSKYIYQPAGEIIVIILLYNSQSAPRTAFVPEQLRTKPSSSTIGSRNKSWTKNGAVLAPASSCSLPAMWQIIYLCSQDAATTTTMSV